MAITIEQIRAARALIDWKQSDLAKAARLSVKAVNKIERGTVTPRAETLQTLKTVFEQLGVEFLPDNGIRLRRDVMEIYKFEGADAFARLIDDCLDTLSLGGGEILISAVDETAFAKHGSEPLKFYYDKIGQIGISERILVPYGDTTFIAPREFYRWLPKHDADLAPYLIYRDKMAVISWGPPLRIVVMHNAAVAETFRRQFEARWERATVPPVGKKA